MNCSRSSLLGLMAMPLLAWGWDGPQPIQPQQVPQRTLSLPSGWDAGPLGSRSATAGVAAATLE